MERYLALPRERNEKGPSRASPVGTQTGGGGGDGGGGGGGSGGGGDGDEGLEDDTGVLSVNRSWTAIAAL